MNMPQENEMRPEVDIIELYEQASALIGKRDAALLALDVDAAWKYDQQITDLLDTLEAYQQALPLPPAARRVH